MKPNYTIGIIVNSMELADRILKIATDSVENITYIDFRRNTFTVGRETTFYILGEALHCKNLYRFDKLYISTQVKYWDGIAFLQRLVGNGELFCISNYLEPIVEKIKELVYGEEESK